MAIENVTTVIANTGLEPLIEIIQPFFAKLSILVGGIFGLYFILIILRTHYERKKVKLLEDIRYDLDQLNISKEIRYSRARKSWLSKMLSSFFKLFKRKVKIEDKK